MVTDERLVMFGCLMPPSLKERFASIAQEQERTMAVITRRLITEYIAKYEQQERAATTTQ